MTKITENIYIGDIYTALDLGVNSKRYDCILNMYIHGVFNSKRKYPKFKYIPVFHVNIDDSSGEDIAKYFKYTNDLLKGIVDREEKVLVHCHAGISRSVTIVLAFLIYNYGFTVEEAVDYIRRKRSIIDPNYGYIKQLVSYSRKVQ